MNATDFRASRGLPREDASSSSHPGKAIRVGLDQSAPPREVARLGRVLFARPEGVTQTDCDVAVLP